MPLRFGVPRTTHQWLKPLYNYIDNGVKTTVPSGASGIANATWLGSNVIVSQVGNATGLVGFYGATGYTQIQASTGINLGATSAGVSGVAATGLGASGLFYSLARAAFNGATGTVYTINDIVVQLKNMGILPL